MGYGLTSGANTTDRSDHGSAPGIDDKTAFTGLVWAKPTTLTGNRTFLSKYRGASNEGWWLGFSGSSGAVICEVSRASVLAGRTSATGVAVANTPLCLAITVDHAATPVIHIYAGGLATPMAEVSYGASADGSGAFSTDNARSLFAGNKDNASPALALQGDEFCIAYYGGVLSLADIERWRVRPVNIVAGSTALLAAILGNNGSTGSQVDLTGNGNNGTVTGATAASTSLALALYGALANAGANARSLAGRGLAG